jgi:hypothetical protein
MIQGIIGKLGTNLEQISASILKSSDIFEPKKDKINIENLKVSTDNVEISDQARASMILSTIAAPASTKTFVQEENEKMKKAKEKNKDQSKKKSDSPYDDESYDADDPDFYTVNEEEKQQHSEDERDSQAAEAYNQIEFEKQNTDHKSEQSVSKSADKGKLLDIKF